MREKKTLKTLPKTSQNNLKWSEHKLLIRKNDIDPPPIPPPPSPPDPPPPQRPLTSLPAGPDGGAARRSSL